jgi:hypothetical protein
MQAGQIKDFNKLSPNGNSLISVSLDQDKASPDTEPDWEFSWVRVVSPIRPWQSIQSPQRK